MRFGLSLADFSSPGGSAHLGRELTDLAQAADELGFESLSVMDHYFQIGRIGPPELPMLEGYTVLAYLAGVTRRITLGTLATGVHYRHPGILAKIATTLDVLSGGRARLGIGAGRNEDEGRGLGAPCPPVNETLQRLDATAQTVLPMR